MQRTVIVMMLFVCALSVPLKLDAAQPYFSGKTITLQVGAPAGGSKINSTDRLGGTLALPPGTPETIRAVMEEALLKVGKDPAFRKDWEDIVLEGHPFEQMFNGKEVVEEVMAYTDWRPEIMSMYKRLAHEAPK